MLWSRPHHNDEQDRQMKKLIPIKEAVVEHFSEENWTELGILTDCTDIVSNHHRLIRSMNWGDSDYPGNALDVLLGMVKRDEDNLRIIEDYIAEKFNLGGINVSSTKSSGKQIVFKPTVFETPDVAPEADLISVMMPFSPQFGEVYKTIQSAASSAGFRCQRADDIWQHSVLIQDVFSLIFRSYIVVCDFTGKNPNVFYEAGVAHTLGKHVVPITQSEADIPFDLRHHRFVPYLNNGEGLIALGDALLKRFRTLDDMRT